MPLIEFKDLNNSFPSILKLCQAGTFQVQQVLPPDLCDKNSLVFISKPEQFRTAKNRGAQAFIILARVLDQISPQEFQNLSVWTCESIPHAMSALLPLFDTVTPELRKGVHQTAVIDPTAQVSPTAHIGPYCVVGAHAKVGAGTTLISHVYIGPNCEIGQNCILAPFVSIGQDGFGFATDREKQHHKIPQIGRVVIEDNCEFGAHCAVDRATLTETRIGKGSKFDNYCHVAHNVQIGENALVAAGFIVAGSTVIGRNLTTAGGVHVVGHVKITDHVTLSGRAGVTQNIEAPGIYGGFPIEPHLESIKTLSSLPHIKILRKQVRKILKHLQIEDEQK